MGEKVESCEPGNRPHYAGCTGFHMSGWLVQQQQQQDVSDSSPASSSPFLRPCLSLWAKFLLLVVIVSSLRDIIEPPKLQEYLFEGYIYHDSTVLYGSFSLRVRHL